MKKVRDVQLQACMYVVQDIREQTFQKTKGPQSLYVNPLHAGEHSGLNYQQYSSIFLFQLLLQLKLTTVCVGKLGSKVVKLDVGL